MQLCMNYAQKRSKRLHVDVHSVHFYFNAQQDWIKATDMNALYFTGRLIKTWPSIGACWKWTEVSSDAGGHGAHSNQTFFKLLASLSWLRRLELFGNAALIYVRSSVSSFVFSWVTGLPRRLSKDRMLFVRREDTVFLKEDISESFPK